jgi:MFS family permease
MLAIQKRLAPSFYALLSLPSTAMGFALSVQISALSWILSTKYGLAIHDIGLVWAAGPIAGIFGQVIVGLISDNVWFWGGRRRPFILIGGALAALMLLALPNIGVISESMGTDALLGVAITVALTLDLAINISFNPTRSIIADVTPAGEARTKGYTWMQTVSGTFGVAAYAIGAIWGNYTLIYFGAILVLLISVIPPFFIEEPRTLQAEDTAPNAPQKKVSFTQILVAITPLWGYLIYALVGIICRLQGLPMSSFWKGFSYGATIVATIVVFMPRKKLGPIFGQFQDFQKILAAHSFTWLGIQTMFVYMFAYVQQKIVGVSDDQMGQVVSISFLIFNAIAAVLPAILLQPLSSKIGRVKTHLICIAIMALGYAGIFLFGHSVSSIYVLMGVVGIGWAATVSLPFAIMSQTIDQSRMGMFMGLFNLSVVLPQLVASLGIGEAISAAEDKGLIFIICALSLAISAVLWLFIKDNQTKVGTEALVSGGGH